MSLKIEDIEIPINSDEKQEDVKEVKQDESFTRTDINSQINQIKCWWCRNEFQGNIFSIPVSYIRSHYPIPNGTAETKSFVEKEVTRAERKMMQEEGVPVTVEESFKLDGIFCSGECRQAFLEEHINEKTYRDSIALLVKYDRTKYSPAMSWKKLKEYGGNLTIEEFRQENAERKVSSRENPINIGRQYLERFFI